MSYGPPLEGTFGRASTATTWPSSSSGSGRQSWRELPGARESDCSKALNTPMPAPALSCIRGSPCA
eukprot:11226025-Lingulodinium_polyedra.AAC.1